MSINLVQRQYLLALARESIVCELTQAELQREVTQELDLGFFASTFVTLSQEGELRGCVGSIDATRTIVDDVLHNAKGAAFHDPRFIEVTLDELPKLTIEISVLSSTTSLSFVSEPDLFAQIEIGRDGVIVEFGLHRATFLPTVWEQLPTHTEFFEHLKRKAQLSTETPLTDVSVSTYQVEHFSEPTVI